MDNKIEFIKQLKNFYDPNYLTRISKNKDIFKGNWVSNFQKDIANFPNDPKQVDGISCDYLIVDDLYRQEPPKQIEKGAG